jgi:signal transduction histidine kinase
VVIIDLDVTEWRATERSLVEVVTAKERLMAVIAHELRNPLAAVVGFNSILATEWEALDEDARYEMVAEIGLQLGDVCTLLDDFLVGSQEAIHVEMQDVALTNIFDSVDLIGVSAEIDPSLFVRGDPVRIRQIMRNLLRNALRYGGPRVRLGAHKEAGRVAILVLDDGPGVSDEIVDRLFEPFVHGGSAGSLGLGLSVSRGLARQMGGDVQYFRHGSWTVFELELDAG